MISTHGRVRSIKREITLGLGLKRSVRTRIMKQCEWYDYKIVFLKKGNKKKFKVHRLVAIHFIPNPDNKPFVNHIDRDKRNNHISNLEWVTEAENTKHWMEDDRRKNMTPEERALDDIPF